MNYNPNDTITAVSSADLGVKKIIRISGPKTLDVLRQVFSVSIDKPKQGIIQITFPIDGRLNIDALLYLFPAPHSYTGDDMAEVHICTSNAVVEELMDRLLKAGVRTAAPGEFTARSYLNGKLDLSQAEAVGRVITSCNRFQLAAAENLLAGRLTTETAKAAEEIVVCLSLIEAGLDFSGEDIEFITRRDAVTRLSDIKNRLNRLIDSSAVYESVIDLPAIGIAGIPGAGKSSLLNRLLGEDRSIVSDQYKTTRDVLSGILTLKNSKCVLFDCAGLISQPDDAIDELSQQAAIEELNRCSVVIFCIDLSQENWSDDVAISRLINPKRLITAATKSDLLCKNRIEGQTAILNKLFSADFLPISTKTGAGIEELKGAIENILLEPAGGMADSPAASGIAVTARHRQAVAEAVADIDEAADKINSGDDELAAMMLRAAHQALAGIGQQGIDEQVLEKIFSNFCVGK